MIGPKSGNSTDNSVKMHPIRHGICTGIGSLWQNWPNSSQLAVPGERLVSHLRRSIDRRLEGGIHEKKDAAELCVGRPSTGRTAAPWNPFAPSSKAGSNGAANVILTAYPWAFDKFEQFINRAHAHGTKAR